MKNILILWIIVLTAACSADEVAIQQQARSDGLVGAWVLVEQKVSIGGPASWEPVRNGYTIQFGADGTFTMPNFDCNSLSYQRVGDLIKLTYDCPTDSEYADWPNRVQELDYRVVELTEQRLTLTSATFMCVEECLYRFARQDDRH